MTIQEAWENVKDRETGGQIDAIGDDDRAAGAGQMWWVFRKDYWPEWCWHVLEAMDYLAFRRCIQKKCPAGMGLRTFYETVYNPHSHAPEFLDEAIDLKS